MAQLQMVVENLDKVDEKFQSLYVEKDGKFHLDVDGTLNRDDNQGGDRIPRTRLNAEIQKRKDAEGFIADMCEALEADVPEEFKKLIPDLPPGKKIKWLNDATKSGFFEAQTSDGDGPDSKRPGTKTPKDLSKLSPHEMLSAGYGEKKKKK